MGKVVDFGGNNRGLGEKVVRFALAKAAAGKRHVDGSIDNHVNHMHTFGTEVAGQAFDKYPLRRFCWCKTHKPGNAT